VGRGVEYREQGASGIGVVIEMAKLRIGGGTSKGGGRKDEKGFESSSGVLKGKATEDSRFPLVPKARQKKRKKKAREMETAAVAGVQARPGLLPRSELRAIVDKKLRRQLIGVTKRARAAVERNVAAAVALHVESSGFIETEGELERSYKLTQDKIRGEVDEQTRVMGSFELNLESSLLGPYIARYSRSGRSLLVAGKKGHLADLDWRKAKPHGEIFVNETVRDATFLHNDQYFAVSQRKYAFIYDSNGIELHCLRNITEPTCLSFLPYHFLLASLTRDGVLHYTDTTVGQQVATLKSRIPNARAMTQNPANACIHRGHANGIVTVWSPISTQPLVTMLCHRGGVTALAVEPRGVYMATAGVDGCLKIWDLRTYKELHSRRTIRPVSTLAVSQKGLLASGLGSHVQIWKDMFSSRRPDSVYLEQHLPSRVVESVQFCPFEDILLLGTSGGVQTMIVPGSGEPNIDSFVPNPFESVRSRREMEVSSLLDKLAPETITLDQNAVGSIDRDPAARLKELRALQKQTVDAKLAKSLRRKRARGRNKIAARLRRRQKNVIDEKREYLKEQLRQQREQRQQRQRKKSSGDPVMDSFATSVEPAIRRFVQVKR